MRQSTVSAAAMTPGSTEDNREHGAASTKARCSSGDDPQRAVSAMGSHHTRRSYHVYDRVCRSHQHIARPAANEPRPAFGCSTGRNARRYFLLGLPGAANTWRPFGETLERKEVHQHAAGRMGYLC